MLERDVSVLLVLHLVTSTPYALFWKYLMVLYCISKPLAPTDPNPLRSPCPPVMQVECGPCHNGCHGGSATPSTPCSQEIIINRNVISHGRQVLGLLVHQEITGSLARKLKLSEGFGFACVDPKPQVCSANSPPPLCPLFSLPPSDLGLP